MGQHSNPGGYPCHDNAVAILRHYQAKTGQPWARKGVPGEAMQLYWLWRTAWMTYCLQQMRPWDMKGLPLKDAATAILAEDSVSKHDPSPTFSGF